MIPEDVKKLADEVASSVFTNAVDDDCTLDAPAAANIIARAILTDREARSGWSPPKDCDGKEQLAFEAWASSERYDMREHPLHYLFMDSKTYAARQGWKAALRYVREQFASPSPSREETETRDTSALLLEAEKALELLRRWDALIEHQYSGSRDAMSDMTEVAQETAAFLGKAGKVVTNG